MIKPNIAINEITTVAGLEMTSNKFGRGHLDTDPSLDRCKTCGHEAGFTDGQRRGQSDNYTVGVACSNTSCGIRTPEHYRDRESAQKAWNRKPAANWQPIETAPKDGSNIFVAFHGHGKSQVQIVSWADHRLGRHDNWDYINSHDGHPQFWTHVGPHTPAPPPGLEGPHCRCDGCMVDESDRL